MGMPPWDFENPPGDPSHNRLAIASSALCIRTQAVTDGTYSGHQMDTKLKTLLIS